MTIEVMLNIGSKWLIKRYFNWNDVNCSPHNDNSIKNDINNDNSTSSCCCTIVVVVIVMILIIIMLIVILTMMISRTIISIKVIII